MSAIKFIRNANVITYFYKNTLNFQSLISRLHSTTKDIITTKYQSQDLLLHNFKNANNANDLLNTVSAHYNVMNNRHVLQALRSLFHLQKIKHLKTDEILKHPSFEHLCILLKKKSRNFELNEIIDSIKILSILGVQTNSTITQILLQLIRYQINNLSLQQIIFLQYILKQWHQTPLVEAMQIALPIVMDIQLKTQIDRTNLQMLCDLLHYASKNQISQENIDLIVETLLHYDKPISVQLAKSIVWSLCDLPTNLSYGDLLQKSFNILHKQIDQLQIDDIETTLAKMSERFSPLNAPCYYHELFVNSCAEYVIERQLRVESAIGVLRRSLKLEHVNVKLLDWISEIYVSKPDLLLKSKPIFFKAYISAVVRAGYFSMTLWEDIRNIILNSNIVNTDHIQDNFGINFTTEMVILNCYTRKLLQHTFNDNYLNYIIKKGHFSQCQSLLLLNQGVKYVIKEHLDLLPNDSIIEQAIQHATPNKIDFPLTGALTVGLGANYFKTNINVKLGYPLDHVILMRKGGYPIAINSEEVKNSITEAVQLEEIENIAQDNQIIGIMCFPPICYLMNTKRLKGQYVFMVKILEFRGIKIIPVALEEWNKLLDFEKIPYIMQKIKLKSENVEAINML